MCFPPSVPLKISTLWAFKKAEWIESFYKSPRYLTKVWFNIKKILK